MARTKELDPVVWQAALAGLEAQRARIDLQIARVKRLLRTGRPAPEVKHGETEAKPRRKVSAAARRRMAAAQRKRWAAVRKAAKAAK